MRFARVFISATALVSVGLADITTIRNSLFDVMAKIKDLDKAITAWSGELTSGGEMLCKTIALRKSMKDCSRTFETSDSLKDKDLSNKNALPLVRLANAMFDLKDHAVAARPKLDGVGATPVISAALRAQKDPASELSTSMAKIFEKMPPSFKDSKIPLPSGQTKVLDFARDFINKEIDDTIKQFEPRPEQAPLVPMASFVMILAKYGDSIDASPFCQAIPPLLNSLGAQNTIGLGELSDKIIKVLETSGAQDLVPLDIITQSAEGFGVPRETIPKILEGFNVQLQGVPLRTFTQEAPRIIRSLNLQDITINPSVITSFINLFVKSTLGSSAASPPPSQNPTPAGAKGGRRRKGTRGQERKKPPRAQSSAPRKL